MNSLPLTSYQQAICHLAHFDLQYSRLQSVARAVLDSQRPFSGCQTAVLTSKLNDLLRIASEPKPDWSSIKEAPPASKTLDRNIKSLRRYAEECFPEITNGQKHFVRVLMESVADDLASVAPVKVAQVEEERFYEPPGPTLQDHADRMAATLKCAPELALRLVQNGICSLTAMDGIEERDFVDIIGFSQENAALIMRLTEAARLEDLS